MNHRDKEVHIQSFHFTEKETQAQRGDLFCPKLKNKINDSIQAECYTCLGSSVISGSQPRVILSPGDIWQCLETFLLSLLGRGGYWYLMGRG